MRILVVEDEEDMLYAIKKGLKSEGYAIDTAADGEEAMELLECNTYDIVVLDINLPKLSGMEVLKELRKYNSEVKVLILSANSEIDDKVTGLDLGANDYLVKPFHLSELKARIRALLRRQFVSIDTVLSFGGLRMDIPSVSVFWNDLPVALTKKEFSILQYLMIKKDKYISSEELIEHVWNEDSDMFSNSIRVHIHGLRKKLIKASGFDNIIETMPSTGYKFNSLFCEVEYE